MDEPDIDPSYLVRELRDSLRGLVGLKKRDYIRYHSFYLEEVIRICRVMSRGGHQENRVRWGSDVVSDCILSGSGSIMVHDRFLKMHV